MDHVPRRSTERRVAEIRVVGWRSPSASAIGRRPVRDAAAATQRAVTADPLRLVAAARRARRREERRVGLDEEPVRRRRAGRPRRSPPRLRRNDEPGEADRGAQLEHRLGVVERAARTSGSTTRRRRRCRTPAARASSASWASRSPAADRQWRIAGLPVSTARREVAAEVRELGEDRREDPVVVEAGLADRDDPRIARRGATISAHVVVVDARRRRGDGRRRPRRATGTDRRASSAPPARRGVPARDEDPLDAGQPGAADDQVDVAVEPVGLEMAVAVDEAHRADQLASDSTSRRGKSGSGAASRPASAAWAPQRSSSRSGGPPLPSAAYGYS